MSDGVIKIAVMALGGQGGGVLAGWLDTLALSQGWYVQTTSVAGVAQRTGATIYYIEMAPSTCDAPVMALSPAKGDVDILLAAEGMEAGRAILRGFVTPDRTILIASTHRALATVEKTQRIDSRASMERIEAAMAKAAKRLIAFDMEAIALAEHSVISAAMFGALASSRALPFDRDAYEATIGTNGTSAQASLRAFARAYAQVQNGSPTPTKPSPVRPKLSGPSELSEQLSPLSARISRMPKAVREIAQAGLEKVIDFQDIAYGETYCDHVEAFIGTDCANRDFALSQCAAKHIANAMAYDDVIRVADRKTRGDRATRIRDEAEIADDSPHLRVTEYLRPGAAEVCGLLPARLGASVLGQRSVANAVDWVVNRGRRVRADRLGGFLILYAISGLRRWRRGTHRHQVEMTRLARWLETAKQLAAQDYDTALELLECQRLLRGYGATHSHGADCFAQILNLLPDILDRPDGFQKLRKLRIAALRDDGFAEAVAAIGKVVHHDKKAALAS